MLTSSLPLLRRPWPLLAFLLAMAGAVPVEAQSPDEFEPAGDGPAVEPNIEVIDGMVLIDGVPEGYMLIEEDIIVPEDFYTSRAVYSTNTWPGGIVPFRFDANVSTANQTAMLNAMALWENVAAVDFRTRNGEGDFVHIRDSNGDANPGNNSFVGPQGGQQIINIMSWGSQLIIAHELGHCLGYWHEQSASDRDNFVQVNLGNVCQTCCGGQSCNSQFQIENGSSAYGPYDFDSVMHYSQCAFSVCGTCPGPNPANCRTITVLPPNDVAWQNNIGQRTHLSFWDMRVMSFMYPQWNWRFVDQAWGGDEFGTFFEPWISLTAAINDTPAGGTLWFLVGEHFSAVGTYTKAMTFNAGLDPVTLGN